MLGLFIGAGASYEVGMPLVDELSNTIRQNVLKRLNTKLFNFNNVPHLKTTLFNLLQNNKYNYEQVLGELEKAYYAERENTQGAWGVVIQFIECIHLLLLEEQKNTLHFFSRKVDDYKGIRELIANCAPLNVFSLNHDIVFEELCSHYQIPLRDGFYERDNDYQKIARFKVLTNAELKAGNLNFYKKNEIGINLLKLHGAIDFFAANDKETFLKSYGDGLKFGTHFNEIEKIEKYNLSIANSNNLRLVNELGVYDSNGEFQFLRRSLLSGANKFKDQSNQIVPLEFLSIFQKKLCEIDELIIIGYSFGDTHINDILSKWMDDRNQKLKIYDPYRIEPPEFLKANYENIEVIQAGLTGFLSSYDTSIKPVAKFNIYLNQQIRDRLKQRRLAVKCLENNKATT